MKRLLKPQVISPIASRLKKANQEFNQDYPGEGLSRQPVHTVYGGAHLFSATLVEKLSQSSLRSLSEYAPTAETFATLFGGKNSSTSHWTRVYDRVKHKLKTMPVEDFRIDFEDGYGTRSDSEEDSHAEITAEEVAKGMSANSLPPFIGIRIKPFTDACFTRSLRTLDLFLSTLLDRTTRTLPSGFVVTLPKITIAEQSKALADILSLIEKNNKLPRGTLKFEIMVEMTQAVSNKSGAIPLKSFVEAGKGRCTGAHFGTYDYTAGCNITANHQTMLHPACDYAKQTMKVALSGTPVWLSDGATNIMPVGPHRPTPEKPLTAAQRQENTHAVHEAWQLSYRHIQHSLKTGFYQGWDLHPAQLPIRYAAVYSFFLESLDTTTERLRVFVEKAARATLLDSVFDDAATGQGLLNFFLRGVSCGAISEEEARATGLTSQELQSRSFSAILKSR